MILNEEIFEIDIPNVVHDDIEISNLETEIPQPGPEIGISNLITQLINSTYSMIEDYNSLSIALSDNQETEKAQIVSSMISNEHVHIGMLQSLLECFSPNADSIETGENIVDSVINESVNSTWVYAVYPKKINDTYEIWNILSDKGAYNKKFLTKEDCWNFIRKNAKYYNWQYAKRSDLKGKQLTDDTQQIIKFNESFPVNNGVDLEKVCRQIWKDLDGDVSDKEDWSNWLEVYWDDIRKLTNGESYTKMTVEGDNSKARLNLKTEGRHIVYKFFDEDEYYTAYDVQEIEDAIKRRNLNESLNEKIEDKRVHYKVRNDIRQALADVFYEYYNKYEENIDQEDFELAIDNFRKHYYPDESLNESFGYCPSFDEWYFQETGVNTSDLDDEQYDDLWNDENLMNLYRDFCDSYKENLTESKVRPNIVNVQGIYDYVVENGFEKEAKEILDDCKIKVIKGKCTEISANANPGNAYYRLSHLVDSKNESLNESMTEEQFNERIETLIKPFTNVLDEFEDKNWDDFSITWNFGVNTNDKITAGLDIRFNPRFRDEKTKKIDEETLKPFLTELEEIIDNNGFELDNVNGYDYKIKGPQESIFGDSRHYQIIEK